MAKVQDEPTTKNQKEESNIQVEEVKDHKHYQEELQRQIDDIMKEVGLDEDEENLEDQQLSSSLAAINNQIEDNSPMKDSLRGSPNAILQKRR